MAGQRIDIMELRQLIQLKQKGLSNRKVAEALGISRNTVNAYVKAFTHHGLGYEELSTLSEKDIGDLFPQADYKDTRLTEYFPYFKKELSKPGCTLQGLWQEYHGKHPDGYRYTQFVSYFNAWMGKVKASGILQHKAGEKLFVDFAGKKLSYINRDTGELRQAEVFVAILPCSQYTFVQAVDSQKREDLISCLNRCLQWLGGVPKAIVSDNLKTAVSKGHKYAPVINKTLKDFALHYGCVVDPTRPYHPQDKALVENAVNLAYQRVYYPLSKHIFFSLKELNKAISEQLGRQNNYCFQNSRTTRRQRFLELEKSYLDPLPSVPYQLRYYRRAKVQKISHIFLGEDKNYYSVPHRYIGQQVEVQYNQDLVEIFFNRERIASHPRSYRNGHYSTIKEHLPSSHQAYNDWTPEYFEKRAQKIGENTRLYISRLIQQYRYPELGYKQAQGILAFARMYPPDRLENACKRGLEHHSASYRTIENILKNNLDQVDIQDVFQSPRTSIPAHPNVRGANNYK